MDVVALAAALVVGIAVADAAVVVVVVAGVAVVVVVVAVAAVVVVLLWWSFPSPLLHAVVCIFVHFVYICSFQDQSVLQEA